MLKTFLLLWLLPLCASAATNQMSDWVAHGTVTPYVSGGDLGSTTRRWDLWVATLNTSLGTGAVYIDGSGNLAVDTTVSPTELGYLNGVTSALQAQIDAKLGTALLSGRIYVGNGSNVATAVTPSGDVTIDNAGATTVNSVGGSTASAVNTGVVLANAATSANTPNTIVKRDGSGNFSGGTFTGAVAGNSSTASAFFANPSDCSAGQAPNTIDASGNFGGCFTPGDVTGQASSVDSEIALFSGTGGKTIKRATGTGLAKVTSGVFSVASSGTDYAPATSGSSILKGNGSGGFSNAASGTDYAPATSGSSILKGNGSGGFSNATSGTDYAPATSGSSYLKGNGSGGFTNQAAPIPVADLALGRTINSQTGTTYTFVLADGSGAGGSPIVLASNASAQTFTVPPNSSVAFPTSPATQIDVCQMGAGKLTIAQGAGVTINSKSGNKSAGAQYVCLSLVKTATDTWVLVGDLIAQILELFRFKLYV